MVASNDNDQVSIWRNDGSGNFTKTLVYDQADFVIDRDGDYDLIGVTYAKNKVAVFLAKTGCDELKQRECCYLGT